MNWGMAGARVKSIGQCHLKCCELTADFALGLGFVAFTGFYDAFGDFAIFCQLFHCVIENRALKKKRNEGGGGYF